jgi:glyoxylase-like metal-dependent hydrolase (beta-lactamase superfamily II)
MTIDGETIEFIKDLQGDYPARPANSMVWIPSLRALIADDVVFRGIHPWLAESTTETRAGWTRSLERVTFLHPRTLVPGHQRSPDEKDSQGAVAFMKKYLETFDEVRNSAADADTFVSEMKKRFPELGQAGFLAAAAKTSYQK